MILRCSRNNTAGVKVLMIPFVFAGLMKGPVFIKVVACSQGPKSQNRFGARKPPFCSGDFESIFDQVSARPLDNTCGDGVPLREVMMIVKIRGFVDQVRCARIDRFARLVVKPLEGGATAHPPCHQACLSIKDGKKTMPDPAFKLR